MLQKQIKYGFLTNKNEIDKIVFLFKNHYYNAECLSDEILRNLANKYKNFGEVMIATYNNEVIGYIAYYRNDYDNYNAYISTVVIKKERRGMRIGKTLLRKVIIDCESHGFKVIKLEVDDNNDKAVSLYKSFGFIRTQTATCRSSYYTLFLE